MQLGAKAEKRKKGEKTVNKRACAPIGGRARGLTRSRSPGPSGNRCIFTRVDHFSQFSTASRRDIANPPGAVGDTVETRDAARCKSKTFCGGQPGRPENGEFVFGATFPGARGTWVLRRKSTCSIFIFFSRESRGHMAVACKARRWLRSFSHFWITFPPFCRHNRLGSFGPCTIRLGSGVFRYGSFFLFFLSLLKEKKERSDSFSRCCHLAWLHLISHQYTKAHIPFVVRLRRKNKS